MCLIFVERIITAKVIERFVKKVSQVSHLTVAYVTGSNTSADALARNKQKETLDSFRAGKVFIWLHTIRFFFLKMVDIKNLIIDAQCFFYLGQSSIYY
jgi:hypothetical protein